MLTDTQKQQFETLGFLRLRQLIPADEMQTYIDAFDETMLKANGYQVRQVHKVLTENEFDTNGWFLDVFSGTLRRGC